MSDETNEAAAPTDPNHEAAYQWLIHSTDFDCMNLVATIRRNMEPLCDNFDLRGTAKVLAAYACSQKEGSRSGVESAGEPTEPEIPYALLRSLLGYHGRRPWSIEELWYAYELISRSLSETAPEPPAGDALRDARRWFNDWLGKDWSGTINGEQATGIYLDPAGFPEDFEVRMKIKEAVAMLCAFAQERGSH